MARTGAAFRRCLGLALLSPIIWAAPGARQAERRQPEVVTFSGASGERVGRWHGPSDRNAPIAVIFCERDASANAAAVVTALWAALDEQGVRSLTFDPMPTVPLRQSLVVDAGRAIQALRSRADMTPSAIGLVGIAASGSAILVQPQPALAPTFVTAIAADLAPAANNQDVINSLTARNGPQTLLFFAAALQDPARIAASLETLVQTPVRRPINVSVRGDGDGVAEIAHNLARWIASASTKR